MNTTSFLISKQLAEAGFESAINWAWIELNGDLLRIHLSQFHLAHPKLEKIIAYDLETILEALPPKIKNKNKFLDDWQLEITKEWIEYYYYYSFQSDVNKDSMFSCIKLHNESLADTAARMWLKLKQEGLV